eukprot:GHVP01022646.1.p2 GENE.GHVP01022646.1~~GHVP01022646.1.p2  ORF type:complete len:124 (+),score=18.08 GHVP01022646.1:1266-1637(+)
MTPPTRIRHIALSSIINTPPIEAKVDLLGDLLEDENHKQRCKAQQGILRQLISKEADDPEALLKILMTYADTFTECNTVAKRSFKTSQEFRIILKEDSKPVSNMSTRVVKKARDWLWKNYMKC